MGGCTRYANDHESKSGREVRCALSRFDKSLFGHGQVCQFAIQRRWQSKSRLDWGVCRACVLEIRVAPGTVRRIDVSIREEGKLGWGYVRELQRTLLASYADIVLLALVWPYRS